VWAVASILGEAERLARLHDRLAPRVAEGDQLVYLGNYFGRGDAVAGTIDELLDFRRRMMARPRGFACDVVYLRGAQEEMWQKLLQLQFAPNPREVLAWMAQEGVEATVTAYGGDMRQGFAASRDGPRTITRWTTGLRTAMNAAPGHTNLFSSLRHAAITEDNGLLFVHAGVEPSRPLAGQADAFWWGSGRRLFELTQPYAGFRRIVRGYDHQHGGVIEASFATSIDGGCGFGGELVAACFAPDGGRVATLSA
jgi:serine/threonine protein phosphatase 1